MARPNRAPHRDNGTQLTDDGGDKRSARTANQRIRARAGGASSAALHLPNQFQ